MGIEVHRDRLVPAVSGHEADVQGGIPAHLGLVIGSSETDGIVLVAADDAYLRLIWILARDLVEKFDGLAQLLVDVEAEGLASHPEVQSLPAVEGQYGA
jgi:hypothetical protein